LPRRRGLRNRKELERNRTLAAQGVEPAGGIVPQHDSGC
jgi:hypothetical protein